jgi:uncharacterized protein
MKIIDIHTHVGDLINGWPLDDAYTKPVFSPGFIAEWTGYRTSKPPFGMHTITRYLEVIHNQQRNNLGTVHNLEHYVNEAGVTHSIILPIEPFVRTDDNIALCGTRADSGRNQPRVYTFASVDPHDPDRIAKLHRYMQAGCLGLKLHPIVQNLPMTDPAWFGIVEEYRRYKKPVIMHAGVSQYYIPNFRRHKYGEVITYEKLVAAFPDVAFIFAHMGMLEFELVWEFAKKYENVYVDTSFQRADNIRTAFKHMGKDRVLYASDFPFSLPKYAVRVGMAATKDRDLREKFFYKNAEALIGELD